MEKMIEEVYDLLPSQRNIPRDAMDPDDRAQIESLKKVAKAEYDAFVAENEQKYNPSHHYKWYEENRVKIWSPYNEQIRELLSKKSEKHLKMLEELYVMFAQKYDVKDVRVYLLVKEFFVNMLLKIRADENLLRSTLLDTVFTESGSYNALTPLIAARAQFTNMYIKLIETLDKITKEDKIVDANVSTSKFFTRYLRKVSDEKVIKHIDLNADNSSNTD